MKPAAIYARVSTKRQEREGTIESQIAALQDYARQHGYQVLPEWQFTDAGVSGNILTRPGLDRLRTAALSHAFRFLLLLDIDRLARDMLLQMLLLAEFREQGLEVVFLHSPPLGQTPLDELMFNITGAFAQYERSKISERMRRGWLHKVRNGERVPQPAPYGYRYLPATEGKASCWEIDPVAAPVVKEVFQWYTEEGWTVSAITRQLNETQVPAPRGEVWYSSMVSSILHRQSYTGQAYYNRRYKDHSSSGTLKRQGRGRIIHPRLSPRPQKEWIVFSVPAIITLETWEKAKERMAQNTRFAQRNSRRRYLLSGLLVCGVCGHTMYATTYKGRPYYRCPNGGKNRPEGVPQHTRTLVGTIAEQAVWESLAQLLQAPERLEQAWEHYRGPDRQEEIAGQQHQLRQLKDQRSRLLDAYQSGLISKQELAERQNPLLVTIEAVESRLRASQARGEVELSLDEFTQRIEQALNASDPELQREIIRLLIERIVVEKDVLVVEHLVPTTSQNFQLRPLRLGGLFSGEVGDEPSGNQYPRGAGADRGCRRTGGARSRRDHPGRCEQNPVAGGDPRCL